MVRFKEQRSSVLLLKCAQWAVNGLGPLPCFAGAIVNKDCGLSDLPVSKLIFRLHC